jgi:cysteine desulfurase/selenocysteine lyase
MELTKSKGCKLVVVGKDNEVPTEQTIIKAINKKTKVIAFANITNLIGYELDAAKITKAARNLNKGIYIICDATQAIPHKRIDVKKTDLDFLVCSAHKMCAGTGIGMVYMKDKYLSKIKPIRFGGGMNNNVSCQDYTFASSPDKFEGGSPHSAGIVS